jgi:hypothetical protein
LCDLDRATLSNPGTRRFLIGLATSWSLLTLCASFLISAAVGGPIASIAFAVFYGSILSAAGTLMISALLSVAAGATGGLVIGSVFTLGTAAALRNAGSIAAIATALRHSSLIVLIAGGIPALATLSAFTGAVISFGIGISGSMTASPAETVKRTPAVRRLGGVVLGVLLSGLIDAMLLKGLFFTQGLANPTVLRVVLGLLVALMVIAAVALQGRSFKCMVCLGSGFGTVALVSLLLGTLASHDSGMILLFTGIITALLYSSLFSVAFSAGAFVGDPWSGAVASALGSGLPFVLFLTIGAGTTPFWPAVPLSFVFICLGLVFPQCLFVFTYPLEMAWNMIVFRADQRVDRGSRLLWNAAFWHEGQRLQLLGLEDHLLLALKHDRDVATRALAWLAQGTQAWAVKAVRIELCAQVLAECTTLESIGNAHRALPMLEGAHSGDPVQSFHDISRNIDAALRFENTHHRHTLLKAMLAQMHDLELQGLPNPSRERLQPILSCWNRLVEEETDTLENSKRAQIEIENPYVIGVPLTPEQEVFVGRTEISAQITQALLGSQAPPLLLYGQRRMGKTSLLNNLGRILPARIVPLFIDLQGPASYAPDSAGFLAMASRAMVDSAKRYRGIQLPSLAPEKSSQNPIGAFDQWLDSIETAIGDRLILLALDEFESLEQRLRSHPEDEPALLGLFRHIVQHRRRFRILVAASHSADEFGRVAGYLINLQMVRIGYLNEKDARQLLERPLHNFALRYTGEAAQRVIDITRGHPHLLQALCYEIVNLKNEQTTATRCEAGLGDVENAALQTLEHCKMLFLDIAQNQISPEARLLATKIARGGQNIEAKGEALEMLLRRDVVELTDRGYRFQVELIRRWFAGSLQP